MQNKIFTILEHSKIYIGKERNFEKHTLSEKDRDYLEKIEFQEKRVFNFIDSKTIKTSSIVGSIALKDGTIIEILPKILKENLDKTNLKKYRKDFIKLIRLSNSKAIFGNFSSGKVGVGEIPLISYILELFANNLLKQLQKGVFQDYSETIESSSVIRGNINIHKTMQKHQFDKSQVVIQYRKHSENNFLMQVFKSITVLLLRDNGISYFTKKTLFEIIEILDGVETIQIKESYFERVEFNRMNVQFQELFSQAKIIYSKYLPFSTSRNSNQFWSILFNMDYLFEKFIAYLFKKSGIIAKEQESFEIYENVRIRPDFMIYENGEIIGVVDSKYKVFENWIQKSGKTEDIRQLVIYMDSLGLDNGSFIMPTFGKNRVEKFPSKTGKGKNWNIVLLNLSLGIDEVLQRFMFFIEKGKLGSRIEIVKEQVVTKKIKLDGFINRKEKDKLFIQAKENNLELMKELSRIEYKPAQRFLGENKNVPRLVSKDRNILKTDFLKIAETVLKKNSNRLLTILEIWDKGKHLYFGNDKKPELIMGSRIGKDIINNNGIFYKRRFKGKYIYGLINKESLEYLKLGKECLDNPENTLEDVIEYLTEAINLNPNVIEAYEERIFAYLDSEKYSLAIQDYNKILELEPHRKSEILQKIKDTESLI